MSALSHETHVNGHAHIYQFGGTERQRIVGNSYRSVSPRGGHIFTIEDAFGRQVYCGNRMSEGLAALEIAITKIEEK